MNALSAALGESPELRDLISSPVYSRADQGAVMGAVAAKMKIGALTANTLSLMASKRRLFTLPAMIKSVQGLIARERGEVTAEVSSAKALSKAQQDDLAKTLKKAVGQNIKIETTVDESLIGGLVVKVGSRMIDTSIRSKLNNLQNAMKEVG